MSDSDQSPRRRSEAGPSHAPLVIHAGSFDTAPAMDDEKGRNSALFALAGKARSLCTNEGKQAGLNKPQNWHKVAKCHWTTFATPSIAKSAKSAHWRGVVVCSSAWACPVCAARIQATRRQEIADAMAWAYANERKAVLLTLTFPHKAFDALPALLKAQASALGRFRSHRAIRGKFGSEGFIRALELTHGANGWHPHTHELHFLPVGADAEAFRVACLTAWRACCAKAGLLDLSDPKAVAHFDRRAVDVIDSVNSGDYLAKLDANDPRRAGSAGDWELASARTKHGRAKGRTVFQLLGDALAGDAKAGRLYVQAIDALRGRPWLYWSQGLKKKVKLAEVSDEEAAAVCEDAPELVAFLSAPAWDFVRKHKTARGELLDVAERSTDARQAFPAVAEWLASQGWGGGGITPPGISKA